MNECSAPTGSVSPNLLVDRLRRLVADGPAERSEAPTRSKHVTYALTKQGRTLEPVVLALAADVRESSDGW